MKCPSCTTVDLAMSERQGVTIDYCPQCRGVWLDRDELDKIIERSLPREAPSSARSGSAHDSSGRLPAHGRQHRRRSWFSDLFD